MGTIYNDMNSNGMMDEGESGISGIMVSISETLTATTGNDGMYTINMVPVGDYAVMLEIPDGYLGDASKQANVSHGEFTTVNFVLAPVGKVMGIVFNDTDADGLKNDSETGIANVTISINTVSYTHLTLPTIYSV